MKIQTTHHHFWLSAFLCSVLLLGGCARSHPVTNVVSVQPEKPVEILANQTLLFAAGQYDLTANTQKTLDQLANLLRGHPNAWARIEGHADDGGSDSFNQDLSELRTLSVVKALIERGVPKSLLKPVSYGRTRPAADNAVNNKFTSKSPNRRVNIIVIGN